MKLPVLTAVPVIPPFAVVFVELVGVPATLKAILEMKDPDGGAVGTLEAEEIVKVVLLSVVPVTAIVKNTDSETVPERLAHLR